MHLIVSPEYSIVIIALVLFRFDAAVDRAAASDASVAADSRTLRLLLVEHARRSSTLLLAILLANVDASASLRLDGGQMTVTGCV